MTSAITAIVTICSHRKKALPPIAATPVSLSKSSQDSVQSAWLEKLRTLPATSTACELYAGRGFSLTNRAAQIANAKLYVVSAGLGLIPDDQLLPVYGLTVSKGHAESVADRVNGTFNPTIWFDSLLTGPHSLQWVDIFERGPGRVLLALTRPYAEMVGNSLDRLKPDLIARLRIFGASLADKLPASLSPSLAPYDKRLDAVLPGTRSDFSQRALLHFVQTINPNNRGGGAKADFSVVNESLKGYEAPERTRRRRQSDEEILHLIMGRLRYKSGVGRILRALRDEEGVACEQLRFARLYEAALALRVAA